MRVKRASVLNGDSYHTFHFNQTPILPTQLPPAFPPLPPRRQDEGKAHGVEEVLSNWNNQSDWNRLVSIWEILGHLKHKKWIFCKTCISPSKAQKHEGHPVKTLPNALYFSRRYKTNVQDVFLFIAYFTKRVKNPVTGSRAPSLVL